jgi:NADPH:quinone reductase-like Zn-dependent oxidoreductase
MQAIFQDRYGPPEALVLRDVAPPVPRAHEVMVRVAASSVNPADLFRVIGRPWLGRLFFGLLRPRLPLLGFDVAGRVEAVGAKVTRFRPGDEVYGETMGAYAEVVCAAEDAIAIKPQNLSFEQAAVVPVAGVTALQALGEAARVGAGRRVLVNGASGGVGTFAVQIARARGAEVTAVCSGKNHAMVGALGATHLVDYTRDDFTATAARYDLILDLIGSAPITRCVRILSPSGIYVSSVGRTAWVLRAALRSWLSRRVEVLVAKTRTADLEALRELLESGAIEPVVGRRFELSEVPQALCHVATGRSRGKSVVRVASWS